ncbi:putative sodium-dependent multivitamin transporter isoform X2 [Macrosteles quadrilineatus]|uniref:putative sodium-dependent multivitamin transporter isoform X2 n=1 Tax=Macrosteles quadrilineatus TaxID=74068 RepID=UPI0023E18B9F|nr:putative sodium-dependent multivitamin transporter isoform X2 [Macrosteles quadrilineatus]
MNWQTHTFNSQEDFKLWKRSVEQENAVYYMPKCIMEPKTLGWADYVVLAITLSVSASIGIYFRLTGGRQKTNKEYLLGGQDQGMLPVAFSLMASFMSSISLLGVSAEIYMYSTLFFIINFAYLLWTPVAAYLYLPVFYKLQATSAYEYLYLRFGSKARTCASLMYSLQMVLYMGIVVYAPAIALEALTGLNQNISIVLVGAVCMFYCTLGGMKAVIWTDVFQSLLMFAAVISIIFTAAKQKGGLSQIWEIAEKGDRIQFFNINPDPTVRLTYFSLLIGGGFTFLSLYAVNQTQVQRYMTMKDYKTAVRSLWISTPILILLSGCTAFSGLAIYSKYYNCDPVLSGRISSRDQLMPLFVVETMGDVTGLSGLFVAGIFSAALSTVSACLNSLAAVTLEDYIKPLYLLWSGQEVPAAYSAQLSKMLALTYGVICIAVAFLSRLLGGVLQASLSIFGMVGGPLLAIFTLGMFCPCANEPGAVLGLLAGLVSSLLLGFGGPKPPLHTLPLSTAGCSTNLTIYAASPVLAATVTPTSQPTEYFYLYRVSYLYYIVISFGVAMVVGLVVSWLASACGRPPGELNPDLFVPPVAKYLRRKKLEKDMKSNREEKKEAEYTFSVHL